MFVNTFAYRKTAHYDSGACKKSTIPRKFRKFGKTHQVEKLWLSCGCFSVHPYSTCTVYASWAQFLKKLNEEGRVE